MRPFSFARRDAVDRALSLFVRHPAAANALLVATGYAAIAITWIVLSDRALYFFLPSDLQSLALAQAVKGCVFVAITAALLFVGLKFVLRQVHVRDTAIRNQAQFEGRLIDSLPEPVFLLDAEGKIARLNAAAERVLGRTQQQLMGTPGLELVAEMDRSVAGLALDRARAGSRTDVRCRILTKRGPTPYQVWSTPLRGADGTVQRILGVGHDRSAIERAEEQSRSRFSGLQHALIQFGEALGAMVEARDPYTQGHQSRVAKLACEIAREAGLDDDRIDGLHLAALVHDIGKIAVPMEFLTKPTRLSDSEMSIIRLHPGVAYDILKRVDFAWPVARIAYQHHERMDGSGYPEGLKGDAILPEARILAIADVIDAMGSDRPYRRAPGLERALEEIVTNRGRLYDPEMVDAALRVLSPRVVLADAA